MFIYSLEIAARHPEIALSLPEMKTAKLEKAVKYLPKGIEQTSNEETHERSHH